MEPFSIPELVAALREVAGAGAGDATVVDLRTGRPQAAPQVDDAPWWATR